MVRLQVGWPIPVSIHASGGEATRGTSRWSATVVFQSTPPGGRRPILLTFTSLSLSFNPRLRGGGDLTAHLGGPDPRVSIHASGGEATTCERRRAKGETVSIHASGEEATADNRIILFILCVSIHASGGEATWRRQPTVRRSCFNPRLRGGGDAMTRCGLTCIFRFQSTPPGGRRHLYSVPARCGFGFNLRLWGGGDPQKPHYKRRHRRFNPRLRGGRRPIAQEHHGECMAVSIHASEGKATWNIASWPSGCNFNPRLRGRGDAHDGH